MTHVGSGPTETPSASRYLTATVEFTVDGNLIRARIPVPAGPARLSDLLPACHAVSEAVVGIAAEKTAARGKPISCKAGCGACCRQLAPIAEPEARAIGHLVATLPEP